VWVREHGHLEISFDRDIWTTIDSGRLDLHLAISLALISGPVVVLVAIIVVLSVTIRPVKHIRCCPTSSRSRASQESPRT
jgi:hypothetical protein